jgi:hypothetical protein
VTWTRLDDTWTDKPELEDLDFATRWHYLAMIQFCCRNDRRTGVIRHIDAMRVSDHPVPSRALAELAQAGLLAVEGKAYRLLEIGEHVPPQYVINRREQDKIRKRRERAHKNGDHSLCYKPSCPYAAGFRPDSHADSPQDSHAESHAESRDGTGRDGTGGSRREGTVEATESWNVVEIGKATA